MLNFRQLSARLRNHTCFYLDGEFVSRNLVTNKRIAYETYTLIIIIIIINISGTGQTRKYSIVYKLYPQPHQHMCHGNQEETILRWATNG